MKSLGSELSISWSKLSLQHLWVSSMVSQTGESQPYVSASSLSSLMQAPLTSLTPKLYPSFLAANISRGTIHWFLLRQHQQPFMMVVEPFLLKIYVSQALTLSMAFYIQVYSASTNREQFLSLDNFVRLQAISKNPLKSSMSYWVKPASLARAIFKFRDSRFFSSTGKTCAFE